MKTVLMISALLMASVSFAAKTYQVTGPVVEVTDSKIIVEKDKEKWEIDRTPETKVIGELKPGQKVTIEYTMSAKNVEAKEGKTTKKK
ncbi:MAG: hypothetical protein ACXVCP_03025 [Bdellovibrio sp.]